MVKRKFGLVVVLLDIASGGADGAWGPKGLVVIIWKSWCSYSVGSVRRGMKWQSCWALELSRWALARGEEYPAEMM